MKSSRAASAPEGAYAKIVAAFAGDGAVSVGTDRGRGFGASALAVRGKIFAMLASGGRFVVKLPRARVDALVAAQRGTRFAPSPRRVMNEWLVVDPARRRDWLALAREAREFAAAPS